MSIIEVVITGIILILAFLHFFPQYSIKTEWDKVLLEERVGDTLNTLDRMDKTFEFATDSAKFSQFMENLFDPEKADVTMIWWKEVNNLEWGESTAIPYFTEGYKESMVDVDNVVFHDNFNDGNDDGWTGGSEWIVDNWEYIKEASGFDISLTDKQTTDNMIIEVNFNGEGVGSPLNALIIFDHEISGDFKFAGGRDGQWVIGDYNVVDDIWYTRASVDRTIVSGTTYEMRVVIKSDIVELYANDINLNFDFGSTEYPVGFGQTGLGGENDRVHFDDFTIRGSTYQVYSFTLGLGYPY